MRAWELFESSDNDYDGGGWLNVKTNEYVSSNGSYHVLSVFHNMEKFGLTPEKMKAIPAFAKWFELDWASITGNDDPEELETWWMDIDPHGAIPTLSGKFVYSNEDGNDVLMDGDKEIVKWMNDAGWVRTIRHKDFGQMETSIQGSSLPQIVKAARFFDKKYGIEKLYFDLNDNKGDELEGDKLQHFLKHGNTNFGKMVSEETGQPLTDEGYEYKYVTIYRAVPANVTSLESPGDNVYVTRSLKFAKEHADHVAAVDSTQAHVIKAMVEAKDVYNAYNPGEYWYKGGKPKKMSIVYKTGSEIHEDRSGTMLGYKVMAYEDGKAVSSADKRQGFTPKKGLKVEMGGNGIYVSDDKQFVLDYYSGLNDGPEVLITFEFELDDIVTGDATLKQTELSVSKAKIVDVEILDESI